METSPETKAMYFAQCITRYVTEMYLRFHGRTVPKEVLVLPSFRVILNRTYSVYKNRNFSRPFLEYLDKENRITLLVDSSGQGLMNYAKTVDAHGDFIRECAMYIFTGCELNDLGFNEAPDIITEAIYQACLHTKQLNFLFLWEGGFYTMEIELTIDDEDGAENAV